MNNQLDKILDEMLDEFFSNEQVATSNLQNLDEQDNINVTVDDLKKMMAVAKPGDKLTLKFAKTVRKGFGSVVFKKGKTYTGEVRGKVNNIKVFLNHENVWPRGTSSTLSKEDFIEYIEEEGPPCEVLDCSKSFVKQGNNKPITIIAAVQKVREPIKKQKKPEPPKGRTQSPNVIKTKKVGGRGFANVSGRVLIPDEEGIDVQPVGGVKLKIEAGPNTEIKDRDLENINKNLKTNEEGEFRTGGFDLNNSISGRMPAGKYFILLDADFKEFTVGERKFYLEEKLPFEILKDKIYGKYNDENNLEDVEVNITTTELEPEETAPEPEEEPTPDTPDISIDIYETTTQQILELIEQEDKDKLKNIYLSTFNNTTELGFDNILEQFCILRNILSIKNPTNFIGASTNGFKALEKAQKRVEQRYPELKKFSVAISGLDEYGVMLPDLSSLENRRSAIDQITARQKQYLNLNLFDIIKNINLSLDVYDVEFSESEFSENPPLNPSENEPRIMYGDSPCNGPCLPKLQIFYQDADKDRKADTNFGYFFYGENDPLNIRKKKRYNLTQYLQKYFGKTLEEYTRENVKDITSDVIVRKKNGNLIKGRQPKGSLENGDVQISSPNFWPIHVALALEEYNELNYKSKLNNSVEYEAFLYFDSQQQKSKYQRQIRQLSGDGDPVNLVPANTPVVSTNIKKILSKRIAYYGLGDFKDKNGKRVKPSFAGRDLKKVSSVFGAATLNPTNNIEPEAQKYISEFLSNRLNLISISPEKASNIPVKTFDGKTLYIYNIFKETEEGRELINDSTITTDEEINLPSGYTSTKKIYTVRVEFNDKPFYRPNLIKMNDIDIAMPSVYFVPRGSLDNFDEENFEAFSKSEKVFAKRIGVRLDRDYKVNLNTGQSNFGSMNFYKKNGQVGPVNVKNRGGRRGPPSEREIQNLINSVNNLYKLTNGQFLYDIKFETEPFPTSDPELQSQVTDKNIPMAGEAILAFTSTTYGRNNRTKPKITVQDLMAGSGAALDRLNAHALKIIEDFQNVGWTEYPESYSTVVADPRQDVMDQDNDLIAGKIKQFFDMVEAKTEDPSYVAKEEEEEPSTSKATEANFLIFGHSQAGKGKIGGALEKKVKARGAKVKRIARSGESDGKRNKNALGLLSHIKKIKGNYTHAILLLGGNSSVPGLKNGVMNDEEKYNKYVDSEFSNSAPDYKQAKLDIINHVTNNLGIPKKNILVMLVPINNDNKYSKSRELLNKRATKFFNSIGIEVAPSIVGGKDDFSDNVHIRGGSEVVSNAVDGILNNINLEDFERSEVSKDKVEIIKIIIEEAKKAGVDPKWAVATAHIESKFDPKAENRYGFRGLFQISPRKDYWREWQEKYPFLENVEFDDMFDPRLNTRLGLAIAKTNHTNLKQKNLIKSSLSNISSNEGGILYTAHNQGLRGTREQLDAASKNKTVSSLPLDIQLNIIPNYFGQNKTWRREITNVVNQIKTKNPSGKKMKSFVMKFLRDNPSDSLSMKYKNLTNQVYAKEFVDSWRGKIQRRMNFSGRAGKSIEPLWNEASGIKTRKIKKPKLSGKEPRHSYIVGDLSADGKIYRSLNENDNSDTSGASMNKPVLALIHLMKYPNAPQRMTDAELKGLLTYTGHESNNVNRLISGRDPLSKKLKARRNEIGKLTKEDTKEYLTKLGLDPKMKIIYGGRTNNQQTPEQYFKFMRLIHDEKKINSLGISEQVEIIKNHMKRTVEGTSRSDREAKRWPKFEKLLRDAGYEITSLYGKGGLVKTSWNYALVINNKYLVSIYTRAKPGVVLAGKKRTTDTANAHHSWFDNKLIEILDGVVPRKKQKVDENLKIIYKYINEVLRGL